MLFRFDGNLYGRGTAGSVYRNELEEILVNKLDKNKFQFVRGVKDPTIFRCLKTGLIVIHHIDNFRGAGPDKWLDMLYDEEPPKFCEVQVRATEKLNTSVEVLNRSKIRVEGAILTLPDPVHVENIKKALGTEKGDRSEVPSKPLNLLEVEPVDEAGAKAYRSAVGSAIYLSADRRDIQYAVKELARHMSAPRQCDLKAARVLGAYLNRRPKVYAVVALDAGTTA